MAQVADYSIIADDWVVEATQDTINFKVPSNIDKGSRSILGFMIFVKNEDDLTMTLRLNGTKVWTWNYTGGSDAAAQFFQEVIGPGVVKPGDNVFSFDSSTGDLSFVKLSDIVVWWQANI